jgi:hypothetical protein
MLLIQASPERTENITISLSKLIPTIETPHDALLVFADTRVTAGRWAPLRRRCLRRCRDRAHGRDTMLNNRKRTLAQAVLACKIA